MNSAFDAQNKPLSYAEEENGTLVGKGVAFEFLSFLQEKYGFNYSVVLPKETENSNATGIFGMLDSGVSMFFINFELKHRQRKQILKNYFLFEKIFPF